MMKASSILCMINLHYMNSNPLFIFSFCFYVFTDIKLSFDVRFIIAFVNIYVTKYIQYLCESGIT